VNHKVSSVVDVSSLVVLQEHSGSVVSCDVSSQKIPLQAICTVALLSIMKVDGMVGRR
jgi:hypothetical protein